MLRWLMRLPLVALPVVFAPWVAASGWIDLQDAAKSAARSDKPVFAVVISDGPARQDPFLPVMKELAGSDADSRQFILATINLYEKYKPGPNDPPNHASYRRNPALLEAYGGVRTCHMFAPGALKPIWTFDDGMKSGELFGLARKAYEDWRKPLDEVAESMKNNRELRRDPDTLAKLAELWATGHAVPPALNALTDAIKQARRDDKADPRIEKWSLRAADIAYAGRYFAEAAKHYQDFDKAFKESPQRFNARLGRAKALFAAGDNPGAIKALEEIGEDAPAEVTDEAAKLAEQAGQSRPG